MTSRFGFTYWTIQLLIFIVWLYSFMMRWFTTKLFSCKSLYIIFTKFSNYGKGNSLLRRLSVTLILFYKYKKTILYTSGLHFLMWVAYNCHYHDPGHTLIAYTDTFFVTILYFFIRFIIWVIFIFFPLVVQMYSLVASSSLHAPLPFLGQLYHCFGLILTWSFLHILQTDI